MWNPFLTDWIFRAPALTKGWRATGHYEIAQCAIRNIYYIEFCLLWTYAIDAGFIYCHCCIASPAVATDSTAVAVTMLLELEENIISVTNIFDICPLGLLSQRYHTGIFICIGSFPPPSRRRFHQQIIFCGQQSKFVINALYMGHQYSLTGVNQILISQPRKLSL